MSASLGSAGHGFGSGDEVPATLVDAVAGREVGRPHRRLHQQLLPFHEAARWGRLAAAEGPLAATPRHARRGFLSPPDPYRPGRVTRRPGPFPPTEDNPCSRKPT